MDPWVIWLIVAGLFALGEVLSVDLVLLMFAGGAVGGLLVALTGLGLVWQLLAFLLVSGMLIAVVRPIAKKHLTESTPLQLTGVDALVGKTARVTRPVDGHGGRIKLGADEWTARSEYSGDRFDVGETVRILKVDGATAVVCDAME